MSSNLDREVLLRVKTDVQGIPQVEQLSGSLQNLAPAGQSAGQATQPLANNLRDIETRATAANQSLANTTRILVDVDDTIADTLNLFELLKLEYIEGKISLDEYSTGLSDLRQNLNLIDGEDTKLLRTKRALTTEIMRVAGSSRQMGGGFHETTTHVLSANSVLFNFQSLARGLNGDFLTLASSSSQFLRTLNRLQIQTGSTSQTLRVMLGVIGGPTGLAIMIGSFLPVAIIAAQKFLSAFKEDADDTAESIDTITQRVLELIKANAELASGPSSFNQESIKREIEETKQLIELLESLESAQLSLKTAQTGEQTERGLVVNEAQVLRAKQNLEDIKSLLGPNINADIDDLRSKLANLESEIRLSQEQINKNTLIALEERLSNQLKKLKDASAEELKLARSQESQLIAYQRARLETLSKEELEKSEDSVKDLQSELTTASGIRSEQIAWQIAMEKARQEEVSGAERDDLLARLKMHEDYVWKLADLYSKVPKPVTPEQTPTGEALPTGDLPSLDPGPMPTGGMADPDGDAYDAKIARTLAAAQSFQAEIHSMEIDMLRQAGREKEALAREQEAELRRIKLEALEVGLHGTEQHLALEQQVRDYYAEQQKALDGDVYAAKIAFAESFMAAIQGFGSIMYGDSERNAKKAFEVDKALSFASAIVYGGLAINRALATSPWEVAAVTVTSAAQIAKIAATKFRSSNQSHSGASQGARSSSPSFALKPAEVSAFHQSQRPQPATQPVVVNLTLEGEFDPEVLSAKVKEGDRSVSSRTITIKK